MTDIGGYIAVLDGAVQDWRLATLTYGQYENRYYSAPEEEGRPPYAIPPQNVTQAEQDDALAWEWLQANICPSCDGFHPDQSGWAGVRCTVGTGREWYHWRPENEEGW